MRWLLDTNVVSEPIRPRPNQAVLSWLASQAADLMAISIVTLAELRFGAISTANAARRRQLMEWIESELSPRLEGRVLPLTLDTLTEWLETADALASKGITRDAADLLIAATARVHDLIVVSRNMRDFAATGVVVYDPWSGETHRMEDP